MDNDFKAISKPIHALMTKDLAYSKLATRHYQQRRDDVAIQVHFQLSHFDTSFYVNVAAGVYQNDVFLPILTSRLGRYAVGGDDDVWQDEDHLFAELSEALSQVLPAWAQVYCQKNNLNHAISHYDLNAGLLNRTEATNECSPLTGQTWIGVYQTWHDDLLTQDFKAKITDDNVFYFKPLKNGKFWAVLWCQLLGYGTFVQIKASVWHSLLQVNDKQQNGTPSDYDSLMILFGNTLHNEQTAWFVGNHHADFIDKNIDDWRKLLPQAEEYWANFHSGGDVIKAIAVEYQRSSYFAQAIEQLRDI